MSYKAVIFDLFGTLVHGFSTGEYEQLVVGFALALRAPVDEVRPLWIETSVKRQTGVFPTVEANVRYVGEVLGLQSTAEHLTQAMEAVRRFRQRTFTVRSDAVQTLTGLRAQGHKLGLISDAMADVPDLWQATPLAALVDTALFSCQVGTKKPDPRMYHLACEQLGVKPQECLYVGDGDSNELAGAAQVGMHPVLIQAPHIGIGAAYRDTLTEWQGPTISSLSEVLALVQPLGV